MIADLLRTLTKAQSVSEGVTVRYLPYVSTRQAQTHDEMQLMYGDIAKWPEYALILWICDAQTIAIEANEDAPEAWRALARYIEVAPQSLADRMRFYQYLPSELVQAWYQGYASVQSANNATLPDKPDSDDPE